MDSLDDLVKISELDKGNVLGSIQALPKQVAQTWQEIGVINFPESYRRTLNIVVSGMGGSALPGRVLSSLFFSSNRAPLEVVTGYKLPDYVGEDTLVILCSYSGNTAETLSAMDDALMKKAKIIVIATGGELAEVAKEKEIPFYIFSPKENPSNQPRMALGYSITSIMAILSKLNFIGVDDNDIQKLLITMGKLVFDYGVRNPEKDNLAKRLSKKIKNKIPVIISSAHLVGISHAFKNQINENAKTFALYFDIPELNHHLLEGLKNPEGVKVFLYFLFLESELYPTEIKKRFPITRDVVQKNGVESDIFVLKSDSKLEQVFEVLVFSSYLSFYLSMLYGIDPSPIPWVDYFKSELAKK